MWILTGIIIVIFILLYFFFYLLGASKLFYSFVKEGEIEFSVTGETLHKILANVSGYYLKKDEIEVEIEKENKEKGRKGRKEKISVERFFHLSKKEKQKKNLLGLYWIGLPPYRKILTYPFSWDRLISKTAKEEEEKKGHAVEYSGIGDIWISHRSEPVSSLFFRYTYPIVAKDIELTGRITIDIAFNVTVEVAVPIIPIFFLKGRWFLPLTAAFRGIISDCLKDFNLDDFGETDKQKLFNDAVSKQNELFVSITGMEIFQTNYIDYTISGEKEELEAATAKKIAQLKAEAKVAEAEGTAVARITVAEGEAEAIKLERGAKAFALQKLLESAQKHPQGVSVLIEQIKTEGLAGFTGDVLSLGQSTPLQIAVNEQNKNKEDKK